MSVSVDIEKRLGSFKLQVAFNTDNCIHGILGASGCGKSLTLKCIAGVITPDTGKIEVNGKILFDSSARINVPPQKRKTGMLFQNYALFPNMTVEGNLRAAIHGKNVTDSEFNRMIERFHLEGLEKLRPFQLSGGQQQRTALARILLTKPDLLMLDEPLSALDSYLRRQTEIELSEIFDDFIGTVLIVTHSSEEIKTLCDSLTVIENGASIENLTKSELFGSPKTLASCLLSGCKNYSRAEKTDSNHIYAFDWGVILKCDSFVSDKVSYAAIHSHNISLADENTENAVPCYLKRILYEISGVTAIFVPIGFDKPGNFFDIELSNCEWEKYKDNDIFFLYLPSKHIMLTE